MKLPKKTIQKNRAKNKSSRNHQYLKHRQTRANENKERVVIQTFGKKRVSWKREHWMYQRGEDANLKASVGFGNWATGDLKQRGMNGKEK